MNTAQRIDTNKLTGSEGVGTDDYIGEGTLLMPGCHVTLATRWFYERVSQVESHIKNEQHTLDQVRVYSQLISLISFYKSIFKTTCVAVFF